MKMILFNIFICKDVLSAKVMTISIGEMFENFILFNGKIIKFKQKKGAEMPFK